MENLVQFLCANLAGSGCLRAGAKGQAGAEHLP